MHQALDPHYVNICLDANALDRPDAMRSTDVDAFAALVEAEGLIIVAPHSVVGEVNHPNTPAAVRQAVAGGIFTIGTSLTSDEQLRLAALKRVLGGNAKPGAHDADATHLFEASKYGGYFITHDKRILGREGELRTLVPPSLRVVTLREFLDIATSFPSRSDS